MVRLPPSRTRLVVVFALLLLSSACSRSAPQQLPPPKPPLEFLGEWGIKGEGPGQLSLPTGIATDSLGNVYVVDAATKFVHKFNVKGRPLLSFQDDRLQYPAGIAVDVGGAIYVADSGRSSVLIYLPDGTFFKEIRGGPQGRLQKPREVGVSAEGKIFVLETRDRIQVFNSRGRFLRPISGQKSTSKNSQLWLGMAVSADGSLYVMDLEAARVLKFNPEGQLDPLWGIASKPSIGMNLAASSRHLFLIDPGGLETDVWTLNGAHVGKFSTNRGQPPAHGSFGLSLAISPKGELLILDAANARVLRFRVNL